MGWQQPNHQETVAPVPKNTDYKAFFNEFPKQQSPYQVPDLPVPNKPRQLLDDVIQRPEIKTPTELPVMHHEYENFQIYPSTPGKFSTWQFCFLEMTDESRRMLDWECWFDDIWLIDYFKNLLEERRPPQEFLCPNCQAPISQSIIKALLDDSDYQTYVDIASELQGIVITNHRRINCPFPDCSGISFVPYGYDTFACPQCEGFMCVKWNPAHPSKISCKKAAFKKDMGKYLKEWESKDWVVWGHLVTKEKGCNFMKWQCETYFWYLCGVVWDGIEALSHYAPYSAYGKICINMPGYGTELVNMDELEENYAYGDKVTENNV